MIGKIYIFQQRSLDDMKGILERRVQTQVANKQPLRRLDVVTETRLPEKQQSFQSL